MNKIIKKSFYFSRNHIGKLIQETKKDVLKTTEKNTPTSKQITVQLYTKNRYI